MRAAPVLVPMLLFAGCLDGQAPPTDPSDCPTAEAFWVPSAGGVVEADGALRTEIVGFFPDASAPRVVASGLPQTWSWGAEGIGAKDANGSLVRFGFKSTNTAGPRGPSGGGFTPPRLSLNSTTTEPGCAPHTEEQTWQVLLMPSPKTAQPGDGVSVDYAGFWLNGTLFSTNIEAVDKSDWPRAGWYTSGDNKPLNVYVYDRDRSERPAYWAPNDPTTNQPAKWSYVPTIAGFNNGLRGLSTGATRVVVLAPEQAYTQPGRENHQLYGDSLVFYIDIVEIVDVPCPPEMPNRAACRSPA